MDKWFEAAWLEMAMRHEIFPRPWFVVYINFTIPVVSILQNNFTISMAKINSSLGFANTKCIISQ